MAQAERPRGWALVLPLALLLGSTLATQLTAEDHTSALEIGPDGSLHTGGGAAAAAVGGAPALAAAAAAAAQGREKLMRKEDAAPEPAMPTKAPVPAAAVAAAPTAPVAAAAAPVAPAAAAPHIAAAAVSEERAGVRWLMLSSLAFLAPAYYAWRNQRFWFALLFAGQAFVCMAYEFCDADGPRELLGAKGGCPEQVETGLRHFSHGLAYFLFLQVALAFLGPEDPVLQRVEENAEAHLGDQARRRARAEEKAETFGVAWSSPASPGVPTDVLMLSRAGAAATMIALLRTYSSWENFHWECMVWYAASLISCVGAFWCNRRAYAAGVLLRLGFWRRAVHCILIPLLLTGTMFVVMEQTGNAAWLHGMWHVVLSLLGIFEMWRVLLGDSVSFGYDDPQHNPVVAHHILLAVPFFGVATMALTLLVDGVHHAGTVTRLDISAAITQPPGEYIFKLGSMFTAAAAAATWRLVDLICAFHEESASQKVASGGPGPNCSIDRWVRQWGSEQLGGSLAAAAGQSVAKGKQGTGGPWRRRALVLGCAAVASGFLGATCHAPGLRYALAMAFFVLQATAVVINAASASWYASPKGVARCRAALAGMLLLSALGLVAASLGMFGRTATVVESAYAMPAAMGRTSRAEVAGVLGVVALGLNLLWPLTWYGEAEEALEFWVQRYRTCG